MSEALKSAVLASEAAERNLHRTLEREYPTGSPIRWANRRGCRPRVVNSGFVVGAAPQTSAIRVRNPKSRKTLLIRVVQILDAMELGS